MIVGVAKETAPGERRVALVPEDVRRLSGEGIELCVESGAGVCAGFDDASYLDAGAKLEGDRRAFYAAADLVVKVAVPREIEGGEHEADFPKKGSALIALLRPLDEPEVAAHLAGRQVTSFALELIPRITRAQSMDVLSSMSTLSGYRAVLLAASALPKIFPMMVTAAGTLSPARVFVIGAGVAGLQAIATAKRLGAVVEAYDTRPVVKDQVQSVGGKFVELDLDTGDAEDTGGYARAQGEEFYQKQREFMRERAAASDVVITTALVPGRKAPVLIDEEAVVGMKVGSVVVDLAAELGGNCALTEPGRTVVAHGVTLIGELNLPSALPGDASRMFSRNMSTFLRHLISEGSLSLDLEDEITRGALLTHDGKILNEATRERVAGGNG